MVASFTAYTVSQVAEYLKGYLEDDARLNGLWVDGEVSGLRRYSSGHTYFQLKDSKAVLRAVVFRNQRGGGALADGTSVYAHGRITFYPPNGTVDMVVDLVRPKGEGELARQLEELKQKLAAQGLFEPSRKRPLPRFPRTVGVVTSPQGAVFHDIQNVLGRRYPLAKLVLAPTQVQGEGAAAGIVSALEQLTRETDCDVVIVARGGGSLEDLWPFNEEAVARAIYGCKTPVISAIGHETDETIADLVADLRAPTPSAAAELAAPDIRELKEALGRFAGQLERALLDPIKRDRANVDQARRQLESGLPDIGVLRRRIDDVTRIAVASAGKLMVQSRLEVDGLHQRLRGLDPRATLKRGFSIVKSDGSGKVIAGTGQVKPGEALTIIVSDGDYAAVAGVPASVNTNVEAKTNTNANGRSRRKQAKPDPGMTRLL